MSDDDDTDEPGQVSTLGRLHGTFMVLAWILSASLGHVIARYFKRTWMIWRIYKYDVWFVVCLKFESNEVNFLKTSNNLDPCELYGLRLVVYFIRVPHDCDRCEDSNSFMA